MDGVIETFIRFAESNDSGIFFACDPDPVTRLELLETLIEMSGRYKKFRPHVVPWSPRDFYVAAPRPLDTSMSPAKLYSAPGRRFDDPGELCRKAAARYRTRAELRGTGRVQVC
jgi:hypothetical protein